MEPPNEKQQPFVELNSERSSDEKCVPEYCKVIRFTDSSGRTKELIFPRLLDLDKPKRPRTIFSCEQLQGLEIMFKKNQYLIGQSRKALAESLGLSETQVKVWFQNRRTKFRRDMLKQTLGPQKSAFKCDGQDGAEESIRSDLSDPSANPYLDFSYAPMPLPFPNPYGFSGMHPIIDKK